MLFDQISADMKQALLAGEALRLSVLRMLISELNYKKIDLGHDLTDEETMAVIRREVKKRDEAILSYTAGGRVEQAKQESAEKEILQKYLPVLLTEEQIEAEIAKLEGLQTVADFGQAMRIASGVFRGRAEGSLVAKAVKKWMESK